MTQCRLIVIGRHNFRLWPLADMSKIRGDGAFGDKADMAIALRKSAYDPKQTFENVAIA
jgi:hypothetical protein